MRSVEEIRIPLSYIVDGASITTQSLEGINTELMLDIREILLDIASAIGVPQGTYSFPTVEQARQRNAVDAPYYEG